MNHEKEKKDLSDGAIWQALSKKKRGHQVTLHSSPLYTFWLSFLLSFLFFFFSFHITALRHFPWWPYHGLRWGLCDLSCLFSLYSFIWSDCSVAYCFFSFYCQLRWGWNASVYATATLYHYTMGASRPWALCEWR